MGGVFFKKFHFVATAVVFVVTLVGIATTANMFGYRDTPVTTDFAIALNNIIRISIHVCLTAHFTWLAYRLFCRWQVVTRKFVNL